MQKQASPGLGKTNQVRAETVKGTRRSSSGKSRQAERFETRMRLRMNRCKVSKSAPRARTAKHCMCPDMSSTLCSSSASRRAGDFIPWPTAQAKQKPEQANKQAKPLPSLTHSQRLMNTNDMRNSRNSNSSHTIEHPTSNDESINHDNYSAAFSHPTSGNNPCLLPQNMQGSSWQQGGWPPNHEVIRKNTCVHLLQEPVGTWQFIAGRLAKMPGERQK